MRVTITGATGMIGRALVRELTARGDEVTALSRNPARAGLEAETLEWRDPKGEPPPAEALRGRDAVVHMLGETIAQRWSGGAKREIRDSRVLTTRNLVSALSDLAEARKAPARVVLTRTGVMLSPEGGALEKMLPFFKLGIGGPVAGGRQYVPWVHLDDVVGAIVFSLDTAEVSGPLNVTAPEPVTNKELSKTLGRVLRRPAFAPVPALAVKTLYGEMAMIVTTGQRVVPGRLTELGYEFRRPDLEAALRDATGRS